MRNKNKDLHFSARKFKEDWRESNPKLHLLYVEWAIPHLLEIDKCLARLDKFANLNLLDIKIALYKERTKLVKNKAHYAHAEEILNSIKKHGGVRKGK